MRRTAAIGLLLCLAHAGPAEEQAPTCRCVLAAKPADLKTVADTGLPELDQRLKTERDFLAKLFGVEPQIVLLADGAPQPVFATAKSVALGSAWLKLRWQSGENRAATVALAHQWAHVLQEQRGLKLPGIPRELHADLLAGWYLGRRNLATLGSGPELDPAFAASLFAAEDPFDPAHEFDLAHEWDPVHEYDPAHEWDPLHVYDVRYVPVKETEGGAGGG